MNETALEVARRSQLGLTPEPVNANFYRETTVPVCGIAALFALGVVVGAGFVIAALTLLPI